MISFSELKIVQDTAPHKQIRSWNQLRRHLSVCVDMSAMQWWANYGREFQQRMRYLYPCFSISYEHMRINAPWCSEHSTWARPVYRAPDMLSGVSRRHTRDFGLLVLTTRTLTHLESTFVRGYAEADKGTAVVNITGDQVMSTIVHELGHLFGLPHCEAQSCLMREDMQGQECCRACHDWIEECMDLMTQ